MTDSISQFLLSIHLLKIQFWKKGCYSNKLVSTSCKIFQKLPLLVRDELRAKLHTSIEF